MQGYQLTFFTEQNRKHGHQSICDWLLKFAEQHGASGGTLMSGAEGFDHAGKFHSAGFFELADQPLAITISVDEGMPALDERTSGRRRRSQLRKDSG